MKNDSMTENDYGKFSKQQRSWIYRLSGPCSFHNDTVWGSGKRQFEVSKGRRQVGFETGARYPTARMHLVELPSCAWGRNWWSFRRAETRGPRSVHVCPHVCPCLYADRKAPRFRPVHSLRYVNIQFSRKNWWVARLACSMHYFFQRLDRREPFTDWGFLELEKHQTRWELKSVTTCQATNEFPGAWLLRRNQTQHIQTVGLWSCKRTLKKNRFTKLQKISAVISTLEVHKTHQGILSARSMADHETRCRTHMWGREDAKHTMASAQEGRTQPLWITCTLQISLSVKTVIWTRKKEVV